LHAGGSRRSINIEGRGGVILYKNITYRKMWRLKIAEKGSNPYIFTTNDFVGRQIWEYDPNAGTPEEREQVEEARRNFTKNRSEVKPSSDLLWQYQVRTVYLYILLLIMYLLFSNHNNSNNNIIIISVFTTHTIYIYDEFLKITKFFFYLNK
jgi:beta-amyrin synthase